MSFRLCWHLVYTCQGKNLVQHLQNILHSHYNFLQRSSHFVVHQCLRVFVSTGLLGTLSHLCSSNNDLGGDWSNREPSPILKQPDPGVRASTRRLTDDEQMVLSLVDSFSGLPNLMHLLNMNRFDSEQQHLCLLFKHCV